MMPLYEYECPHCASTKTSLRSVAERDDPQGLIRCGTPEDHCYSDEGGRQPYMERKVSASSFALKGKGWAKDGYSS